MTRTESSCSKSAKPIHRINHYQMDKYCVVPENIHTPHTENNGNFEGRGGGVPNEAFSEGGGGCLQRFYPGGLSKIGE